MSEKHAGGSATAGAFAREALRSATAARENPCVSRNDIERLILLSGFTTIDFVGSRFLKLTGRLVNTIPDR